MSLTRLLIDRCYATRAHYLNCTAPSLDLHCGSRLTVQHVPAVTDSFDHRKRRQRRFFPPLALEQILGNNAVVGEHRADCIILRGIRFDIATFPT